VFLFPDRQPVLHFIDDEAAGAKGLVAVRRRGTDPDGDFAQRQRADPVHA